MVWLEGPTQSLLHRWTSLLEGFALFFYFEVEMTLMIDIHLTLLERFLACTHVDAFLMDQGYLPLDSGFTDVEFVGVFDDLALALWCLFYTNQYPCMRSTSLILIYGDRYTL
jgi:hypothetical protein